jgi:energy-coupling factor transporter ATP-binding protein EcfA2
MSAPHAAGAAAHNPFATRYVRPGALEYVFSEGDSAAAVVDRLAAAGWRGAIVGRHGSGKSTLLAALRPELSARGRKLAWCELHDGQRRLPVTLEPRELGPAGLVVVDGYEQLGGVARARLRWRCRRRGWGLLVTAHRPVGLPTLLETAPSPALAQALVRRLTAGRPQQIDEEEVAAAFAAHAGDVRETLFALYDLYEARQRHPRGPAAPPS